MCGVGGVRKSVTHWSTAAELQFAMVTLLDQLPALWLKRQISFVV
jgi:uncharacterized protein (DUF924 family)